MKTKQWFIDRIGKTVFRDPDGCDCATCQRIVANGLTIADADHAEYMFDVQNESAASEGVYLNYRDEK